MKFTRENYLRYVEQVEEEYTAHRKHESSLANNILNKPTPDFLGGVCVLGIDYTSFFDCVLSGCEQGNTTWATYVSLYDEDIKRYYKTWKVNCHTMEMFKTLINSICKCEKFAQVVTLSEGSDWCEG